MDGLRDTDLLSLRTGIVRRVRADIVAGHAAPGTMYSVPLLAEELGVSTTPLRQALREPCGPGRAGSKPGLPRRADVTRGSQRPI